MNWQSFTEIRASSDYENAGRRLYEAYQNIEQKMKQIEFLAKSFMKASKTYVKSQHDVNTKTYVRALETLESHKKAADLLATKIKETSDKIAQFGALTTTIKPCPKEAKLAIAQNPTPTTILATEPSSTVAILETASEMIKTSDVTILPIAIETTTAAINNDDIFADSLKHLNLNYNNVLQNIGDKAIEADEVNTVVPPVAVML